MAKSNIEWTDQTWNPVTGCSPCGPECENCYAKRMALNMRNQNIPGYEDGFGVVMHPGRLSQPRKVKQPQRIFLCSMGDLFHERVSWSFQSMVFDTMMDVSRHVYLVLTKRPSAMKEFLEEWIAGRFKHPEDWYQVKNIWLGTSIGVGSSVMRAAQLAEVPARNRFLSVEPLIGDVDLSPVLHATTPRLRALWEQHIRLTWPGAQLVEWVIVGGETGPGARPMREEWAEKVRMHCSSKAISFFFKKFGDANLNHEMQDKWAQYREIPLDIQDHLEPQKTLFP